MASDVDICNEALSHLGDNATVSSISPPEGSAQAEHCARFYPSCLATLLEMHPWAFATKRIALAQVANPSSTWAYAYAQPNNCVNLLSVLDPAAADDYSAPSRRSAGYPYDNMVAGLYTPQDFSPETNDAGDDILLTNQAGAVLRYTCLITDTAKFTPMFKETLTWMLASKLAGPVLKGDSGRKAALQCMQTAMSWFGRATDSDASSRKATPQQHVGWLNAR